MSETYLGEIRAFSAGIVPKGWMAANGRVLKISDYKALFSLIGTTYGGDGRTTFALPDLRARSLIGSTMTPAQPTQGGGTINPGDKGGLESVTLTKGQMGGHAHAWLATANPAGSPNPSAGRLATPADAVGNLYAQMDQGANNVTLAGDTVGVAGGNAPHENMQPYLVMIYCIAVTGVFPTRD
ncbi:tail fiber protein [Sphingomonas sp. AOB5]|uniref:phage tail protein n=1 Tax=Sphingomonas sp. AOB5 TaxID=3034017 RepID=UPI0023F89973|nr:tail fiber protein [Sphingomonas sp. AOB5]MDF7775187.1 tail fiber protein [Sphingomonas sp. AOB5]